MVSDVRSCCASRARLSNVRERCAQLVRFVRTMRTQTGWVGGGRWDLPPARRTRIYSIRRPEMARLMTSCWISDVPSKIVWIMSGVLGGGTAYGLVGLTGCFAARAARSRVVVSSGL